MAKRSLTISAPGGPDRIQQMPGKCPIRRCGFVGSMNWPYYFFLFQVFFVCSDDGRGEPMLCPNGTLFNQALLVCDWWFNVACGGVP